MSIFHGRSPIFAFFLFPAVANAKNRLNHEDHEGHEEKLKKKRFYRRSRYLNRFAHGKDASCSSCPSWYGSETAVRVVFFAAAETGVRKNLLLPRLSLNLYPILSVNKFRMSLFFPHTHHTLHGEKAETNP